jgi:DNA mismatch repair protein MutL
MPIRILDDHLVNQIAAGEVIERPASIVKELMENSIDAGASHITVEIAGGGLQLIEVEDDGAGMNSSELPLAFLRHATSKISTESDLFSIHTMGFRGEALPSIASVSRVEVFSCVHPGEGVRAVFLAGSLEELSAWATPPGTRIRVEELFFNTPARKKFLKSPVTEGNQVHETVCRYALARPDISFTFKNEKRLFFKTPGSGKLEDAVTILFGGDFSSHLREVSCQGSSMQINGLVSALELTRKNRKQQYFFVNRRPVRGPLLFKAIDSAYAGLLISRQHPVVVLSLDIDPRGIDVNVHPQKSEVRFNDEKAVFHFIREAVLSVVKSYDVRPYIPAWGEHPVRKEENAPFILRGEQFQEAESLPWNFRGDTRPSFPAGGIYTRQRPEVQSGDYAPKQAFRVIGQCLDTYIVLEWDGAIYLVDQHAAHERIIFEELRAMSGNMQGISQQLIVPQPLELSSSDLIVLEDNQDLLASLGFQLEPLGHRTLLVRAAPATIHGKEMETLLEIIDLLREGRDPDLNRHILCTMACKKAVKAGECLNGSEMEKIVTDLLRLEDYQTCPHGRPTLVRLGQEELERMFKRS